MHAHLVHPCMHSGIVPIAPAIHAIHACAPPTPQLLSSERSELNRLTGEARKQQREAEAAREDGAHLLARAEGRERRSREAEERAVRAEKEAGQRLAEAEAALQVWAVAWPLWCRSS